MQEGRKEDKFKSLEVREASSSHLKIGGIIYLGGSLLQKFTSSVSNGTSNWTS